MRLLARYVLFYCDDCDLLTPAIEALISVHKFHIVLTSSNEDDLVKKINTYSPELLFVYLNDPMKDYITLVKVVRAHPGVASIPLLIYKELPSAQELITAFEKIKM